MADLTSPLSLVRKPDDLDALLAQAGVAARVQDDVARAGQSETQKALNLGLSQLRALPSSVSGLARNLVGPEGSGNADLVRSKEISDDAARFAPKVQTLADIHGAGDALAYGRNALVTNLPTIAPLVAGSLATGGIAGLAAGGARVAAEDAVGIAARTAAKDLALKRGTQAGALAGATALQTTQLTDTALDKTKGGTARGRAAKAILGSIATGALDALPEIKLLGRYGLGGQAQKIATDAAEAVAKPVATTLAGRIAKHVLEQGAFEGTTEALQAVGEHLTHKWVNDNEDLLGPAALADYLNSFAGGAIVGGALGGPAGFKNPDHVAAAKENYRKFLKTGAQLPADQVAPGGGPGPAAPPAGPGTQAPADSPIFGGAGKADKSPASAPADDFEPSAAPKPVDVAKTFGDYAGGTTTLPPGATLPADQAVDISTQFQANKVKVEKTRQETDLNDQIESNFNTAIKTFDTPGSSLPLAAGDLRTSDGRPNGLQLFNLDTAALIHATGDVPAYEAAVASALPVGSGVSKSAVIAAGRYLKTGHFTNSRGVREFLSALDDQKQVQFHIAAQHIGQVNADNKAAGGEPLTPKQALGKAAPTTVDPASTTTGQALLAAEPDSAAKIEKIDIKRLELPDVPDNRTRLGVVAATNSKGSPRLLMLSGLATQVKKTMGDVLGQGPARDVNAVIAAIGIAKTKGFTVNPASITTGLHLYNTTSADGAKTPVRLTAQQAKMIRQGLSETGTDAANLARAQSELAARGTAEPVQLDPAVAKAAQDNMAAGLRAANQDEAIAQQQTQGAEADNNREATTRLIPRTRSPITADRLSAEGALVPGETADTAAIENTSTQTGQYFAQARRAQSVLNRLLSRDKLATISERSLFDTVAAARAGLFSQALRASGVVQDKNGEHTPTNEESGEVAKTYRAALQALKSHLNNATDNSGAVAEAEAFGDVIKSIDKTTLNNQIVDKTLPDNVRKEKKAVRAALSKMTSGQALSAADRALIYKEAGVEQPEAPLTKDRRSAKGVDRAEVPPAERHSRNVEAVTATREALRKDRQDADIGELAEGKTPPSPVLIAKEQALVDGLSQALGIKEGVKIESAPGQTEHGVYNPATRTIKMGGKRTGSARLDTLLHEFGHHIISTTWSALPAETRATILKDYKAWLKKARSGDKTWAEVRSGRNTNFITKWLRSRSVGNVPYRSLSVTERQHLLSVHEYLADNLAKALGKKTQGTIGKFFADLAEKLKAMFAQISKSSKYQPAANVEAWVDQLLRAEQARVVNGAPTAFEQHEALKETLGVPVQPPATTPNNGADSASPSGLFWMLNARDRRTMERAFSDLATRQIIYRLAPPELQAKFDRYGYDMADMINYGAALFIEGKLPVGTNLRSVLRNVINFSKLALGMRSDRQLALKILQDYKDGVIKNDGKYNGNLRAYKDANPIAKALNTTGNNLERTVVKQFLKLTSDAGERLRATQVPALRRLGAIIDPLTGESSRSIGFVQEFQRKFVEMVTPLQEAVKALSAEEKRALARALQSQTRPAQDVPKLAAAYDAVQREYQNLLTFANGNGVSIPTRKDYFPVEIDVGKARENIDEFTKTLNIADKRFEDDVRKFFSSTDDLGNEVPNTKDSIETLLSRLAEIAVSDPVHVGALDFGEGSVPGFKNKAPRLMGYIQAYGTPAEKAAFAEFQSDDLDATNVSYVRRLTKRTTAIKLFGKSGEKITELLERAKTEGATPDDLKQAQDFVNIAMGSYKAELNPTLKWAFGKLDDFLGTNLADMSIEQWAHYQRIAGTYQNARLLALAAFSSFTDPLGLYARSGDLAGSIKAYKDAVKAFGSDSPSELRSMAERLYVVQRAVLSDSFAASVGGIQDTGSVLGRINNAIFRLNGLEAITRFSRLAAVSMGHQFLLKHAALPSEHSERYLRDLNISPEDIKRSRTNPDFVELNPKVEAALYRFVEESVLRPKSTQRPNWHNDPNFIFAAQYRGYLYSFYNNIIKRLSTEVANGNAKAAVGPIVGYIAVTMAAEIMRETVRFGVDGNPNREKWDLSDYFWLALMRSGLSGPKAQVLTDARGDVNRGNVLLNNSWYGPSGQQLINLAEAAVGQKSKVDQALETLPGEIVYAKRIENAIHE